ncbi:unnamed protein product [Scytosiphon promiscuus]
MFTDGDIRWRDVDPEGVKASVAPKLARNRPFLMSGYWADQVLSKGAAQRWKTFAGIKSVLAAHGLDQLRVDVSCTKKGDSFRGDKANRQQVNLKLMDMVEMAEAHELGKPHWAASEEIGLDFYLCQCPVVSREEGKPEVLTAIAGEFRTPWCVSEENLLQMNLWLGAMETTTNLHYDANHNLLFVIKGSKRVALLPPSMTAEIHAMPVFSESVNHAGLHDTALAALMASEEASQKGAMHIDVAEGEAVYIPEGWWHQVSSLPGTVAVNVWFKGVRPGLCEGASRHMREYYLRCLVESLLADRLREASAGDDPPRADVKAAVVTDGDRPVDICTEVGAASPKAESAAIRTKASSPLCNPQSTTEERNAYLRAIGTDGMKQELPSIAHDRPQDWTRLVDGLDPLTAYVMTTRWEAAGGAASMPEFYAAIFGTGDDAASTTAGDEKDCDRDRPPVGNAIPKDVSREGGEGGQGNQTSNGSGGESGVCRAGSACGADIGNATDSEPDGHGALRFASEGDARDGKMFEKEARSAAAENVTMAPAAVRKGHGSEGHALPPVHQQQEREQHNSRQVGDVVSCATSEGVSGVALQERLMRLRETFAKEQCGAVLNRALGW